MPYRLIFFERQTADLPEPFRGDRICEIKKSIIKLLSFVRGCPVWLRQTSSSPPRPARSKTICFACGLSPKARWKIIIGAERLELSAFPHLFGETGFEPATPRSQSECATTAPLPEKVRDCANFSQRLIRLWRKLCYVPLLSITTFVCPIAVIFRPGQVKALLKTAFTQHVLFPLVNYTGGLYFFKTADFFQYFDYVG